MTSHRGRHRRPSQAGKIIGTAGTVTAGGVAAATMIMVPGAQAAPRVIPVPHHPRIAVTASAPEVIITVRAGQYLSLLAKRDCGNPQDWTGIYDRNDKLIGGNPDLIIPGQHLILDCRTGWAPALPAVTTTAQYHAASRGSLPARTYAPRVSTAGDGSFQACVISRESGGNPQVMNSSGHYGLYQFSESTWEAYGGSSSEFGHASVAEQNQVFGNAMARGGESNWSPYDGC